jgi:hypothetical protein
VGGQHYAPAALPLGPIIQEAGWAPGPVWKFAKNIPDRPARSQSLYRLSYPDHNKRSYIQIFSVETRWKNKTERPNLRWLDSNEYGVKSRDVTGCRKKAEDRSARDTIVKEGQFRLQEQYTNDEVIWQNIRYPLCPIHPILRT